MAKIDWLQALRNEMDALYPRVDGKGPGQHLIGSNQTGGFLDLSGADAVHIGGALFDETNRIVGINNDDPEPGIGVLQVGGALRVNQALDDDNRAFVFDTHATDGQMTATVVGYVRGLLRATNEVVGVPLYRLGGATSPTTWQRSWTLKWDIQGTTTVADNFDRANSATSLGTSSGGQVWQTETVFGIISTSLAYPVSSSGITPGGVFGAAWLPGQAHNGTIEVTFTALAGSSGMLLSWDPSTHSGYMVTNLGATRYRVWKITQVAPHYMGSVIGSFGSGTATAGDRVKCVISGTSYTFSVDTGAGYGSGTALTCPDNSTSVNHGLCIDWNSTNPGTARWDNYLFTP